jgi:hypothetical protein
MILEAPLEISNVAANTARGWMKVADNYFAKRKTEAIRDSMQHARDSLGEMPRDPYSHEANAWRDTATEYNSRVSVYAAKGIRLRPIDIPYNRPH